MTNQQIFADRVKHLIKMNGLQLRKVLDDMELSVNFISSAAKSGGILSTNLVKFADYFDCSIDYLLGRTDNPTTNQSITANINSSYSTAGNNNSIVVSDTTDGMEKDLLTAFRELDRIGKLEVMLEIERRKQK